MMILYTIGINLKAHSK